MGRVLADRYELVRFLGRGGMGEVWEGLDRRIERRVAIKLLLHAMGNDSGAALFLREARTAGRLNHPGVVTVHDIDLDGTGGPLFLVMEFVDGRDLDMVLYQDAPPPVPTAAEWAAQAAAALACAHEAGIVHRDLKPSNLMLTRDGTIKILDFGIARFMDATHHSSMLAGTWAYMPPERFDGHPGDARSDVYSLGCVLHQLLTGRTPFDTTSTMAMMAAHRDRAPAPPGQARPGVPAALDELVLALLAKDPDHRPASAAEVRDRLQALRIDTTTVASTVAPAPTGHSSPAAPPSARGSSAPAARCGRRWRWPGVRRHWRR